MRKHIAILAALFMAASASAAVRIEAWITVTNTPIGNTQTLVWNGALTRTWTNAVVDSQTQIQTTNSIGASRTNLKSHLAASLFTNGYTISYGTNTDDVIVYGLTNDYFTVAIGGLWARVRYYTNTVYGQAPYALPYTEFNSNQFRIFQQSVAVTNLDYSTQQVAKTTFAFTNFPHSLRTSNPPMTNMSVFGGTNRPNDFLATNGGLRNVWASNLLVTNLTGTSLALTNVSGVDTNGIYTNAVRMNIDRIIATNATLLGASVSNATLTNVAWLNGYLGGLTNGRIVNAFVTNSPSILATNANLETLKSAVATINSLTTTNPQVLGAVLVSTDGASPASVIFNSTYELYDNGTALILDNTDNGALYLKIEYAGNTVLPGPTVVSNSLTIASNTTSYGTISTASLIASNAVFTGTNRFDLAISLTATNITTLANGVNLIDPGLKSTLRISGPTAAYSIDKITRGYNERFLRIRKNDPYTLTIANESGSGGGAATDRVLTGTGGNVTLTNYTGTVEMSYDETLGRWILGFKSN